MIVEIDKSEEAAFVSALQGSYTSLDIASQEHFFGEPDTVNILIEIAPSMLNVIASTIALFAAKQSINIKINGNKIDKDAIDEDEIKELIQK